MRLPTHYTFDRRETPRAFTRWLATYNNQNTTGKSAMLTAKRMA